MDVWVSFVSIPNRLCLFHKSIEKGFLKKKKKATLYCLFVGTDKEIKHEAWSCIKKTATKNDLNILQMITNDLRSITSTASSGTYFTFLVGTWVFQLLTELVMGEEKYEEFVLTLEGNKFSGKLNL